MKKMNIIILKMMIIFDFYDFQIFYIKHFNKNIFVYNNNKDWIKIRDENNHYIICKNIWTHNI
jgi:hypothetical protein